MDINQLKNKRHKSELSHMDWEIDTVYPFKCTTGKAGDVKRFKTLNEALLFADKEPGRVLVTGWLNGKFKVYLYRFL